MFLLFHQQPQIKRADRQFRVFGLQPAHQRLVTGPKLRTLLSRQGHEWYILQIRGSQYALGVQNES